MPEYLSILGSWVFETWRRELSTPAAVPWRGVAPCFRLSQLRSYPPCLRHTDVLLHTVFVSVFLFLPIPVSGTQRCVIVLLATRNITKMCPSLSLARLCIIEYHSCAFTHGVSCTCMKSSHILAGHIHTVVFHP